MDKVNLAQKPARVRTHWDPHVVADHDGHDVMVVKFAGEFPLHVHDDADDLFLVLDGQIEIDVEEDGEEDGAPRTVTLGPGELMVVPRGVRHRPRAVAEAQVLPIERAGLPNTGDPATAAAKPRL